MYPVNDVNLSFYPNLNRDAYEYHDDKRPTLLQAVLCTVFNKEPEEVIEYYDNNFFVNKLNVHFDFNEIS